MYREWIVKQPSDDAQLTNCLMGVPYQLYFELFVLLSSEATGDLDNSMVLEDKEQGFQGTQSISKRLKSKFTVAKLRELGQKLIERANALEARSVSYV